MNVAAEKGRTRGQYIVPPRRFDAVQGSLSWYQDRQSDGARARGGASYGGSIVSVPPEESYLRIWEVIPGEGGRR